MCLGIPGEVIDIGERDGLRYGRVRFGGVVREVCLDLQRDAAVGDFVLVHVGLAIARLDREEAERTLEALRQLGQLSDLEGASADDGGPP